MVSFLLLRRTRFAGADQIISGKLQLALHSNLQALLSLSLSDSGILIYSECYTFQKST